MVVKAKYGITTNKASTMGVSAVFCTNGNIKIITAPIRIKVVPKKAKAVYFFKNI